MRVEIRSAANFLTNLLRVKCPESADIGQLELFSNHLEIALGSHYQQHWFPESPNKGSGYRCIRINHKMDPILSRAGSECGFDEECLRALFPSELTMWIDPQEVSYRIGENGSICVLYEATINTRCSTPSSGFQTPPKKVSRSLFESSGSSDDDSCSPMSMSPPSPSGFCKDPSWDSFIMDPRNINFEITSYAS